MNLVGAELPNHAHDEGTPNYCKASYETLECKVCIKVASWANVRKSTNYPRITYNFKENYGRNELVYYARRHELCPNM